MIKKDIGSNKLKVKSTLVRSELILDKIKKQ